MPDRPKHIIHLDMDAFYAAVEVLDNPVLRGKAVIVGGSSNRGVVSSASYEARKYGVHSAQPTVTARRLCPDGIFLPVRMGRYKEVSNRLFSIFRRFTPLVEPLSIDEAFLDVTGSVRLFGTPVEIARNIKRLVRDETGLTVSAGVAPTKFLAKIASDLYKPDGLTVVPLDGIKEFLDPLPVQRLWGVGKTTLKSLERMKVLTIRDLRKVPLERLEKDFGKHGTRLHFLSRGIDAREVEPEHEVKSLGKEETYTENILRKEQAKKEILALAMRVSRRIRRYGFVGRTVTLKVKYDDFMQVTRSETQELGTDDAEEIFKVCCKLLRKTHVGKKPVRLLGISLSQLSFGGKEKQLHLFNQEIMRQRRHDLNVALDKVSDKFGEGTVQPATLFQEVDKDR